MSLVKIMFGIRGLEQALCEPSNFPLKRDGLIPSILANLDKQISRYHGDLKEIKNKFKSLNKKATCLDLEERVKNLIQRLLNVNSKEEFSQVQDDWLLIRGAPCFEKAWDRYEIAIGRCTFESTSNMMHFSDLLIEFISNLRKYKYLTINLEEIEFFKNYYSCIKNLILENREYANPEELQKAKAYLQKAKEALEPIQSNL